MYIIKFTKTKKFIIKIDRILIGLNISKEKEINLEWKEILLGKELPKLIYKKSKMTL